MSQDLAPWLLSSKVSPPRISINANRRDNLLDLLSENFDKRVILLEAPAGFGKTLLLSQWREVRRLEETVVAWLSVNQADQPDILLPYIAFAFHQAGLKTEQTGLSNTSFSHGDLAYQLGNLLSQIEKSERRCILIFDDFENVSHESLNEIIENLLQLQPANLQLVFACRQNPGLSLSSLSVEGNVLKIGPQHLSFDRKEIDHFFHNSLANAEIENIIERTGGWPVALQLIRAFGDGSSSAPGKLELATSSKLITDYFREQLFDHLSETEQAFLLETSMLDVITLDCADFIRQREDANDIIHGLDYLEGIFSALDDEQESWRVHPLVRELLEQELKERSVADYQELCLRVARWMSKNDRGLEAMRYALSADSGNYAAEILEEMGGIMLWIREGMSRLTTGLQILENFELEDYPRIQLGRCLLHMKSGDMNQARQAFETARRVSGNFSADRKDGNDILLKIESYSIEIMMAEYGCTPDNPILPDTAFTFLLENTSEEPTIHGYVKTLQCLTSLQVGDFDGCFRHGEEAITEYLSGHSLYGELFIYFYFGMAELARTNTAAALKQYRRATQTIHSEFPGDTGLKLLGNAILAEYYWETGDSGNTKKHIRHVINNIGEMESYFDIYMAAYQTSISFLLYDKGLKEALAFIDEAMKHAKKQSLDRLEDFLLCNQLSILYLSSSQEAALELLETNTITFNPGDSLFRKTWREIEAFTLALSRAARMQGRGKNLSSILSKLSDLSSSTNNQRLQINILLQKTLIHLSGEENEAAINLLARATELASHGHYFRPFLNEQSTLAPILQATLDHMGEQDFPTASVHTLEELMKLQSRQNPIPGEAEGFSTRELQILSELSEGQADKLIARQTGLSAHGVRYHLKNIYQKMGVENRVQAVSRARELGLIEP